MPVLLELASQLEAERDHVLGRPHRDTDGWEDQLLAAANARRDEPDGIQPAFTALGASAELDQVIFDGSSFGTAAVAASPEEQEYLGLPGLLEPEQVRALLRQRQQRQLTKGADRAGGAERVAMAVPSVRERLAELRKELNALVAMHHHRTGKAHGAIHSELRQACGGPPTAMASAEQLQQRIAALRNW